VTEVIDIKGENGYLKLYPHQKTIEIQSLGFYVKGKVEIGLSNLESIKSELKKCIDCESESFGKCYIISTNKLLGIEIRYDEEDEKILLIGDYRESEEDGNRLEFEWMSTKNEITNAVNQIEKIMKTKGKAL
jgi:hypothetical protein